MPISPDKYIELAVSIRRIYEESETVILRKIAQNIADGLDAPEWQNRKLAEIRRHMIEINKTVAKLQKDVPDELARIIWEAYTGGIVTVDEDLKSVGIDVSNPLTQAQLKLLPDMTIGGSLSTALDPRPIQSLVLETMKPLQESHKAILRRSEDVYRRVISDVTNTALVGAQTRQQVAQRALNKWAGQGVVRFVDEAGKNWDLASYSEMATRTAVGRATFDGFGQRMEDQGRDLVIVSEHAEECELCRPWEGQVLSLTGRTPGYRTLEAARQNGLFHPNCGHRQHAYIPGLTEKPEKAGDPNGYEQREKQRYMERAVREWKKREALAISDDERVKCNKKVKEWQFKLREFTAEYDRAREYDRESIKRAR